MDLFGIDKQELVNRWSRRGNPAYRAKAGFG